MESSQILTFIFAFGCPARVPNFSSIKWCIPELEWFLCLYKKKKKKKMKNKNRNFDHSYLGNSWCNLLQLWNVASYYRQALPPQMWCSLDKRSRIYECVEIVTLLFLLIYSLPFAHALFSWTTRNTTVYLDPREQRWGIWDINNTVEYTLICTS